MLFSIFDTDILHRYRQISWGNECSWPKHESVSEIRSAKRINSRMEMNIIGFGRERSTAVVFFG